MTAQEDLQEALSAMQEAVDVAREVCEQGRYSEVTGLLCKFVVLGGRAHLLAFNLARGEK